MTDNIRDIENLYECRNELKILKKRYKALLDLYKLTLLHPEMLEALQQLWPASEQQQ